MYLCGLTCACWTHVEHAKGHRTSSLWELSQAYSDALRWDEWPFHLSVNKTKADVMTSNTRNDYTFMLAIVNHNIIITRSLSISSCSRTTHQSMLLVPGVVRAVMVVKDHSRIENEVPLLNPLKIVFSSDLEHHAFVHGRFWCVDWQIWPRKRPFSSLLFLCKVHRYTVLAGGDWYSFKIVQFNACLSFLLMDVILQLRHATLPVRICHTVSFRMKTALAFGYRCNH